MRQSTIYLCLCCGLIWLNAVQESYAQANTPGNPSPDLIPRFQSIAPQQPLPEEFEETVPPEPEEPDESPQSTEILVEALLGIMFHDSPDKIVKEGFPDLIGMNMEEIPFIQTPEFEALIEKHIGPPVTLENLRTLVKDVRTYYKGRGYPVVDVLIPEQEISNGTIQVVIVEGRVGQIKTEGNRWFSDELLLREITLKPGGRIASETLRKDIQYLNQNVFRDLDVVFEQGELFSETDIVLSTQDRFPIRFFAGYEDSGNDLTADERLIAGFNWGNAFFEGHTLNYQTTLSPNANHLRAYSAIYSIPLFRHHELLFLGSYSTTEGDFLSSGVKTLSSGVSWQVGARYSLPVPFTDPYDYNLRQRFTFGYDFKQTYDRQDQLGTQIAGNWIDISQLVFGYSLRQQDDYGFTTFDLQAFYSPGNFTHNNRDEFFNEDRSQSGASYTYFNCRTQRMFFLPWDFRTNTTVSFQFSDKNLVSAEQMRLGGYDSVRGYDEDEVRGDEGWLVNLELQLPAISIMRLVGQEALDDELRFHGFWDYGVTGATVPLDGITPADDENPNIELSGVGVGLRYTLDEYLTIRADYGFQLIDTGLNSRHSGRWHIGVILSY